MRKGKHMRKDPEGADKRENKTSERIKKYLEMRDELTKEGVDLEILNGGYHGRKARKTFIPKEEAETLDVAEHFGRSSTQSSERTVIKTPIKGQKLVDKREIQVLKPDGNAESIIEIALFRVACGKIVRKEDIAGYCEVCNIGECSEHLSRCAGYKDFPCNKPLCIRDTFYFTDEDGTRKPCCPEHYTLKVFRQKNFPDYETDPEKLPKKADKGVDRG